jgi:hypothetical protein
MSSITNNNPFNNSSLLSPLGVAYRQNKMGVWEKVNRTVNYDIELGRFQNFILNFMFILSILCLFSGIWVDNYRWKLIFSGVFIFGLLYLVYYEFKARMLKLNILADKI